MKRKFLQSIVIMIFASLFVTNGVLASDKAFSDVSIYYWAKPNIDHLVELGAIDGLGDGRFGIGKNVTRAESSKIIVESLSLELVKSDKEMFRDVPNGHWAKDYIETLYSNGIIDGFADGTFKPSANLTREQMAKILSSSFKLTKQAQKPFKDVSKSNWAYDSIMKLSESGMTSGYEDNTYRPKSYITREQMAVFVSRGIANRDGITLPEPTINLIKKTDKFPGDLTLSDPISKLPSKAKLFENDRTFHSYNYKENLPGGGNISEIIATSASGKNTIYVKGKDNKGDKFTGIYLPDELDIKYANYLPAISSDGYDIIYDIGGEFAVAYGWQDVYHMIQMNIIYNDIAHFYAPNTNTKTLGAELDEKNKYDDIKFTIKKENDGRVIHSYDGVQNNDKYEWIITSDSCEGGVCSKNIDSIKFDKDKEFMIIYQDK